jgi:hypothetical protein
MPRRYTIKKEMLNEEVDHVRGKPGPPTCSRVRLLMGTTCLVDLPLVSIMKGRVCKENQSARGARNKGNTADSTKGELN